MTKDTCDNYKEYEKRKKQFSHINNNLDTYDEKHKARMTIRPEFFYFRFLGSF